MAQAKRKTESPEHGAAHCLTDAPYRMVVFVDMLNGTPRYQVAGSDLAPRGAEKALRLAHERHGGNCFYCKKPVATDALTIDHVQPRAAGGGADIQNLLIACAPCNKRKGATVIEFFKPEAGREWLSAVLHQVQARLNRL